MSALTVVDHPLLQHKLSLMRRKETATGPFRQLLREIGTLLAYEITRDLPVVYEQIETPICTMQAPFLDGKKLCVVSILRAGNGLLDGFLDAIPSARVGHIGLYRDPETRQPVEYYFKLPTEIDQRMTVVVDPMLATGHSAAAAVTRLKQRGATHIRFVCLVAAPEGVEAFHAAHPDVPLWTVGLDERLNDHAYIVPGLGDCGDRLYGTR